MPKLPDSIAYLLAEEQEDQRMREEGMRAREELRSRPFENIGQFNPLPLKDCRGWDDTSNAVRLAATFGHELRYIEEKDQWYVWDGRVWKENKAKLLGMAQHVSGMMWDEWSKSRANPKHKNKMEQHVRRSRSKHGLWSMIDMALSMLNTGIGKFDDHPMLFNAANCTVDLETGRTHDHRQRDYLTKISPTSYNPKAKSPTWDSFNRQAHPAQGDVVDFIERLLGYGITGDISEHILPIFWGKGGNGKGVTIDTFQDVVGRDYTGAPPHDIFMANKFGQGHPTGLMTLHGKRLMIDQETGEGEWLNESMIKHLTGGDLLTARGVYENYSSFKPTHKLAMCTNHKPQIRGINEDIWGRVRLVEFGVSFRGKKAEDSKLRYKLLEESEGILACIVRGGFEWHKQGKLLCPASVMAATKEYAEEQNTVAQFVQDHCQLGKQFIASATELWTAYQKITGDCMTQQAFGTRLGHLSNLGISRVDPSTGKTFRTSKGKHGWNGLRLLSQISEEDA